MKSEREGRRMVQIAPGVRVTETLARAMNLDCAPPKEHKTQKVHNKRARRRARKQARRSRKRNK